MLLTFFFLVYSIQVIVTGSGSVVSPRLDLHQVIDEAWTAG